MSGNFGIFQAFLLASFVHLSTLVGVVQGAAVECFICDSSLPLYANTCPDTGSCPEHCFYRVSENPKVQYFDCFTDALWPSLNINNRWASDGELLIINQKYSKVPVHSAYVCDKFLCNKLGAEENHGHYGKSAQPSSAPSSFLQQQNFGLCQTLLLLLLPALLRPLFLLPRFA